jgi:hypothetical protein
MLTRVRHNIRDVIQTVRLAWKVITMPASGGAGTQALIGQPQGVMFPIWDSRATNPGFNGPMIVQTGRAALASGTVTLTFPIPYTSATSYVVLAIDGTATAAVGVGAKTATTAVINGTTTDNVDWIAWGY